MFKNKTGRAKKGFMDSIEMFDINSYEILGINKDATDLEIVSAYIGLIGQYNCDSNPTPDVIKKLVYIKLAYDLLTDDDLKMVHDYLLMYFTFKREQEERLKELNKELLLAKGNVQLSYIENDIFVEMVLAKMMKIHYLLPFWLEYKKETFQRNKTNNFDSKMKILY